MSASMGHEEHARLRRAEDAWLDRSAERLRRAARRPGSRTAAGRPGPAVPVANEEDER